MPRIVPSPFTFISSNPPLSDPSLLESLLDFRRYGPPPFLVRNLRYVHEHKSLAKGRIWDLHWTQSNYRSSYGPRHLTIVIQPSRCIIPYIVADKVGLENPTSSHKSRVAFLQICLIIRQEGGKKFSFASRPSKIRVWIKDHIQPSAPLDDVPFSARFDLSSFFSLLTAPLVQISLAVRISSIDYPPSNNPNRRFAYPYAIVGALVIWKRGAPLRSTALPNEDVIIPLRDLRTNYPFNDKDVPDDIPAAHLGENSPIAESSICLRIDGQVQHGISYLLQSEKPKIFVTLKYASSSMAWKGIVRHDFICPWCHRNCHRFRSLLGHLQIEHDELKFTLQGMDPGVMGSNSSDAPFTVTLDVVPMKMKAVPNGAGVSESRQPTRNRGAALSRSIADTESLDEDIYINPSRYPNLVESNRRAQEDAEMEARMKMISLDKADSTDVTSTVIENEQSKMFLSMVKENLWNFCSHCGRRHDRSYVGNDEYCSGWCEGMHRKDGRFGVADTSLFASSTQPRERKINFKEAFGKSQMFHIVSVSEMKEDHYDEDDPDSEEEVDQSWRLDLNIERVRSLQGVSAKEKVLWILWNKFAHSIYPIPSLYGERYTRYTLELFVLDHRAEIEQLKLRTQLFGFIKALHVHGLIDSRAVLSVMECLDGKKKRRDITSSARPELPVEKKGSAPGPMKKGRGGIARRKSQHFS